MSEEVLGYMDPTQSKMTLRFEIKSLEPQRKTIDTVPEIENLSPDLEAAIAVKFPGIEHPNWYTEEGVLACILREFDPNYCPAWRRTQADTASNIGLSQLIARSLESELQISLESDRP